MASDKSKSQNLRETALRSFVNSLLRSLEKFLSDAFSALISVFITALTSSLALALGFNPPAGIIIACIIGLLLVSYIFIKLCVYGYKKIDNYIRTVKETRPIVQKYKQLKELYKTELHPIENKPKPSNTLQDILKNMNVYLFQTDTFYHFPVRAYTQILQMEIIPDSIKAIVLNNIVSMESIIQDNEKDKTAIFHFKTLFNGILDKPDHLDHVKAIFKKLPRDLKAVAFSKIDIRPDASNVSQKGGILSKIIETKMEKDGWNHTEIGWVKNGNDESVISVNALRQICSGVKETPPDLRETLDDALIIYDDFKLVFIDNKPPKSRFDTKELFKIFINELPLYLKPQTISIADYPYTIDYHHPTLIDSSAYMQLSLSYPDIEWHNRICEVNSLFDDETQDITLDRICRLLMTDPTWSEGESSWRENPDAYSPEIHTYGGKGFDNMFYTILEILNDTTFQNAQQNGTLMEKYRYLSASIMDNAGQDILMKAPLNRQKIKAMITPNPLNVLSKDSIGDYLTERHTRMQHAIKAERIALRLETNEINLKSDLAKVNAKNKKDKSTS